MRWPSPPRSRKPMHGQVTGSFAGGSRNDFKEGDKHNSLSWSIDLAKLYPNCHMNYSIIFTDITSKLVSIQKLQINANNVSNKMCQNTLLSL